MVAKPSENPVRAPKGVALPTSRLSEQRKGGSGNGLNERQRVFVEFVSTGMAAGRAYEAAGYGSKGDAADTAAARLLKADHVRGYLEELREPRQVSAVATRQKKREILYQIMTSEVTSAAEKIRAIQVDNAMTGDNQPIKIEGELTIHNILASITTPRLPGEEEDL